MSVIASQLEVVKEAIASAAARSGRNESDVQLVAVSKTHPPEAIQEALEAGQTIFGESRVQEAKAKIPLLPSRARWHFIGHLQKNKIAQALTLGFELFHGIDSLPLAQEMNRLAHGVGALPHVLLEINVAGESTKYGFSPEVLERELEELLSLDRLSIDGLMCLPPPAPRPEDARKHFARLRVLREGLQGRFRLPLPQLSMGMSGDYPVAIEEGATLVRVGTAIFGHRTGKTWKPVAELGFDD